MLSFALQYVVVGLLVIGSTGYAAWTLMPSNARRALAGHLLKLPLLPSGLESRLRLASQATSGCGCDGCDRAPANARRKSSKGGATAPAPSRPTATVQPITFHPRVRH